MNRFELEGRPVNEIRRESLPGMTEQEWHDMEIRETEIRLEQAHQEGSIPKIMDAALEALRAKYRKKSLQDGFNIRFEDEENN